MIGFIAEPGIFWPIKLATTLRTLVDRLVGRKSLRWRLSFFSISTILNIIIVISEIQWRKHVQTYRDSANYYRYCKSSK